MSPPSGQRCFIDSFGVCIEFLKILKACKILDSELIMARLVEVNINDAAFVEGMRHNTHLQGLRYVP
jgi:hypothetical protein